MLLLVLLLSLLYSTLPRQWEEVTRKLMLSYAAGATRLGGETSCVTTTIA